MRSYQKTNVLLFLSFTLLFYSARAQDLSTFIAGGSYYLDNIGADRRLKSNNADTDAITVNTTDTGWRSYWNFIDAGGGYVYIQCVANGKRLQGVSNVLSNESSVVLGAASYTGNWVKWKLTKTGDNWLIDNKGHNARLNVLGNSNVAFGNTAFGAAWSQWKITDITTITTFNVTGYTPTATTKLGVDEDIKLTFNDVVNAQAANNIDVYINKTLANHTCSWSLTSATSLSVRHNTAWTPGDLITILINPSIQSVAGITYTGSAYEYEFIVNTKEDFGFESVSIPTLVTRNNGAHNIPLVVELPADRTNKVPVHLWVHGGGWSGGTAAASVTGSSPHSEYLAEELGIATLEIAYRALGSNGTFAMAMEDIESAYQWVIANAGTYNFDLDNIFLSGGSAGTPLSSLFVQQHDDIKAYVGFNGIFNFAENPGSAFPWNGSSVYQYCVPSCTANSAIYNIRNAPPASLLLHGDADTTINYTQSTLYASAITAAGGNGKSVIYPGEKHAFFNTGQVQFEDCLWEMVNFLKDNNIFQKDLFSGNYYLDNVGANLRLKSNNANTDAITSNTTDTGSRSYWNFIDAGGDYVYIECVTNGKRLRGTSNILSNQSSVSLGSTSSAGDWVKWKLTKTGDNWLIDNKGHNARLNVLGNSTVAFGNITFGAAWSQWKITERLVTTAKNESPLKEVSPLKDDLILYPNPVKAGRNFYLDYISNSEEDFIEIKILNVSGIQIIAKKINTIDGFKSYEVNTNQLSTGLYFVDVISNGQKVITKKIIVN